MQLSYTLAVVLMKQIHAYYSWRLWNLQTTAKKQQTVFEHSSAKIILKVRKTDGHNQTARAKQD